MQAARAIGRVSVGIKQKLEMKRRDRREEEKIKTHPSSKTSTDSLSANCDTVVLNIED